MPIKSLLSEMSVTTQNRDDLQGLHDASAHLNADDTLADPSKASVNRNALDRRIIKMAFGDGHEPRTLCVMRLRMSKNNPPSP